MELNPDQELAASTLGKSVLVRAGAGSGKTRMLTQRFLNAVVGHSCDSAESVDPTKILTITFTAKAAGELAERVRTALRLAGQREVARDLDGGWISTVHTMCSRILRREALRAGIDPLFVVGDAVSLGNLRSHVFDEVVVSLMERDRGVAALMNNYDYETVLSAVLSTSRALGARGLECRALEMEPVVSCEQLLAEVEAFAISGECACQDYRGSSQSVSGFVGDCANLLEKCVELRENGCSLDEATDELGSVLAELKLFRANSAGLGEAHVEHSAWLDSIRGTIATAVAQPFMAALVRLVSAYELRYAQAKADRGLLDFDDLQSQTMRLLEQDPQLAARYREMFALVMVDEFQDTDGLQLRLVQALSGDNLCSVGDDKQSIYRFRGADVEVYREHVCSMLDRGAEDVKLRINYRSHPEILGFVNTLFSRPEFFGSDLIELEPPQAAVNDQPADDMPRVETVFVDSTGFSSEEGRLSEARILARRFAELVSEGVSPSEMVILLRKYRYAHVYAAALGECGIPAVIVGGSRFFDLPEVSLLRSLVRVVSNPLDDRALGNVLASEIGLSDDALIAVGNIDSEHPRKPLWEKLGQFAEQAESPESVRAGTLISAVSDARRLAGIRPLGETILRTVEYLGLDLLCLSRGNVGVDAYANVLKFAAQADEYEAGGGIGPGGFTEWLDDKEARGEVEAPAAISAEDVSAVRIMSVHSAKGLEFPVVAVADLASGGTGKSPAVRFSPAGQKLKIALALPADPERSAPAKPAWFQEFLDEDTVADNAEADRVLYVAFTRAQDLLIASGWYALRPKKPSAARNDVVRLARALDLGIPISGEMDGEVFMGGSARVRCRVISADAVLSHPEPADSDEGVVLPVVGADIRTTREPLASSAIVSYSHLALFERCPKRFQLERIMGLGSGEGGKPDAAQPIRFGSALHSVLQMVDAQGNLPSPRRRRDIAAYFELEEADSKRLERDLEAVIGSAGYRRTIGQGCVYREAPISTPLGGGKFVLVGSMDVYARTGDEGLILDYKTGGESDSGVLRDQHLLQAMCYGLAALSDGCARVEVVFLQVSGAGGSGGPNETVFEFAVGDRDAIEERLLETCRAMDDLTRKPASTTAKAETCHTCPYFKTACNPRLS